MWGRGGRGHEEEEPAKKQKWQEWWQVPWAGIESQRQGKREAHEKGLGHQFEMPQRGKKNSWQEGIESSYLYLKFSIHGLFWLS